jgi:nucleoside-diphosphate-sugar epimerase
MRVLIVGCGYIGQAVGEQLVQLGHQVWGMRRTPDSHRLLQQLGIRPIAADITRPETLAPLTASYDWVVHCVSSSHGGAEDYRRVYLDGSKNLLNWLTQAPPKKVVYTSSTSVYGQSDGEWVDESSLTEPGTETGRILLQTERLLLGAGAVVLRVAGIYGPGRGYRVKQFLAGQARIEGKGERFLNMIHREDVAGAVVAALERGAAGQVYNAVDDEPVSQRVFFQWLSDRSGRPLPQSVGEMETGNRKRGVTNKQVSNRRLRSELGYAPKYPTFREGV